MIAKVHDLTDAIGGYIGVRPQARPDFRAHRQRQQTSLKQLSLSDGRRRSHAERSWRVRFSALVEADTGHNGAPGTHLHSPIAADNTAQVADAQLLTRSISVR
jgi:hypothetical protein